MYVQRCPECGQRLKTNYCDICMRKVPFSGVKLANRRDPWDRFDGSSAHRREKDHECVRFDDKKPKKTTFRSYRKTAAPNKKGTSAVAIILAVLSLLPALFGLFEEAVDSVAVPAPEPQYNIQDGFVEAGDLGAEDVPNVIAGEVYNANGIRITADSAGLSYGEYTIFMTIHNDTDQMLGVSADLVSVNGYMLPFGLYHDVKAGKSAQTSMTFHADALETAGITQIADVAFSLDIYENNTFESIVSRELVTIQTEYDGSAEAAVDTSGLELYNDGSFRVILRDVSLPGYGECELNLYMENLSGSTANVYCGQVWVNGEEVAGSIWKTLRPDTRAIDNGYVYELESLDIQELSQIEEITIDLYVEYMDGWDVVEAVSESITFEPSAIY